MDIIDADGHVNDIAGQEEIAKYMPAGNRTALENPGAEEWVRFLDETGISCSVLYPTFGLAVGRFVSEHWAIAACRAYNNWLHEKFIGKNSRLKGMALIPIQDVEASVAELRRAVKELGMLGGMLPSNGEGIKDHLGAKLYWPIYEEAEKLGCALAVHVGSLHHLGMDGFSTYYPVHALGHPFGIAIQAAGLLAHGIFEKFPGIRVAFLEGGSTWVPFFLDRLDRSYHPGHLQVDFADQIIGGPKAGEKASDYLRRQMREGRIYVGFDVDDDGLGFAVKKAGREAFVFGSDFPHEVFNAEKCRHEIDQMLARADLTAPTKRLCSAATRDASMGLAAIAIDVVGCPRFDRSPGERKMKTEMSVQCGTTQRITPAIVFALTLQ
jgi:predicted TIM-barrel fold metal-dependent hydrolase